METRAKVGKWYTAAVAAAAAAATSLQSGEWPPNWPEAVKTIHAASADATGPTVKSGLAWLISPLLAPQTALLLVVVCLVLLLPGSQDGRYLNVSCIDMCAYCPSFLRSS